MDNNKRLFLGVCDYLEECVLTGDKKLIEETRQKVVGTIIDAEVCRRQTIDNPSIN